MSIVWPICFNSVGTDEVLDVRAESPPVLAREDRMERASRMSMPLFLGEDVAEEGGGVMVVRAEGAGCRPQQEVNEERERNT